MTSTKIQDRSVGGDSRAAKYLVPAATGKGGGRCNCSLCTGRVQLEQLPLVRWNAPRGQLGLAPTR
jgi:hypothetical protein